MNRSCLNWVVMLVLASACGETPCERACSTTKPQLVRDFGVLSANVDCSDPKWRRADTCEKCRAVFESDYGVVPTQSCASFGGATASK